jgi:geranylgeranyl diphosphate synthase, type I
MTVSSNEVLQKKLIDNSKVIDSFIDIILKSGQPEMLYDASRHLIISGGKRLRPFLTVKACEAVGGIKDDAIPFAAGLEILHNFTLVHDDIMDNDSIRRGAPTVHIKWGVPIAVAAGDLLFAKVYEAMTFYAPEKISCKRIRSCIQIATKAAIQICEGQALDVAFPNIPDVSEKDYFAMVGGKTSALFRACTEIGATVGGGSKNQIKTLGKFAWDAGIAFQLMDDYLGVTANEQTLGKPVGNDIKEGKKTLIVIHALKKTKHKQNEKILATLGKRSSRKDEIEDVIQILKETGSINYTLKCAEKYAERSKRYIKNLPDSSAKKDLLELVDYFTKRSY